MYLDCCYFEVCQIKPYFKDQIWSKTIDLTTLATTMPDITCSSFFILINATQFHTKNIHKTIDFDMEKSRFKAGINNSSAKNLNFKWVWLVNSLCIIQSCPITIKQFEQLTNHKFIQVWSRFNNQDFHFILQYFFLTVILTRGQQNSVDFCLIKKCSSNLGVSHISILLKLTKLNSKYQFFES